MMQTAPTAPRAPPRVAAIEPFIVNPCNSPCAESQASGTNTPIKKYATPTQSNARIGLPSATWPRCNAGPYNPQARAAPRAKIIQSILGDLVSEILNFELWTLVFGLGS